MSNGIYDILGKLASLTPKEEPKQEAKPIYESVEAKGSIAEGVKSLHEKYMGFKAVEKAAKKGGAENPAAVAASIGRKKYGKAAFQKAAATGKKMGETLDGCTMGAAGVVGEEEIHEKAAPGQEAWIKKNKQNFINQYGKKKGLEVLYATAWKRSKQDENASVCSECGLTETECTCVHEGEITRKGNVTRHTKTDFPGYPADDLEDPTDKLSGPGSKAKGRPRKATTVNPRVDPNAPKKGRGRPKADKPAFSGKNVGNALQAALGMGTAPKKHPKGRVHRMDESRMLDETGEALEHILNRFKSEVKAFEQGADLDQDLYYALYDYYVDMAEMPYGVQKARTGDPYDWITQRLDQELGVKEGEGTEKDNFFHNPAIPDDEQLAPPPAEVNVPDLEEELNELARLAGLKIADEGNQFSGALAKAKATHQDTFDVAGQEYPVKEADVAVDASDEEELANAPDEKYATIKSITTQGDDLNRQKKQDPHTANKAANPLTNDYMQLEAKLAAEYESIKKVSK